MNNIAIIGKFFTAEGISDGQTVKTNILTDELESVVGKENVIRLNTYGWKKHPWKLLYQTITVTRACSHVIMMTDAGGIKVFPWLLRIANFSKKSKLHYVVVGGWLVHFLEKHRFFAECLKCFEAIYVETRAMKSGMEKLGFENLYLMPNAKALKPLEKKELLFSKKEPYRLCVFSRIMKEKGIEEAVKAVKDVNSHYRKTVYTLDIYGQVDPNQITWFEDLSKEFPSEIQYCGVVQYDKSVETLKSYYALLFPTKFFMEGIPGTIIDSYAAGVPVIATQWENYADIIENGVTGISYSFSEPDQLTDVLIRLASSPELLNSMKLNCLSKFQEYLPENALDVLINKLMYT